MRIGEQVWNQLKQVTNVGLRDLMVIDEAIHRGQDLEKLYRTCLRFRQACEAGHDRSVIQKVILELTRELEKRE